MTHERLLNRWGSPAVTAGAPILNAGLLLTNVALAFLSAQTVVHPPPGAPPDDGVYRISFPQQTEVTAAYIDRMGNAYIGGSTRVALAATTGAAFTDFRPCPPIPPPPRGLGRPGCNWAFVAKLSPAGDAVFLTYLPEPNGNSQITQVTADSAGNVYAAGTAATVDNLPPKFPVTPGAYQTTPDEEGSSHFVAKLNASGSAVSYATYFANIRYFGALSPDAHGNLYVAMGTEFGPDLPLIHPLAGMAPSVQSAYLVKMNSTGSSLLYATWVSAPGARTAINGMALDRAGDLYLAGGCFYPFTGDVSCVPVTPSAIQSRMPGSSSSFVMRIGADGSLVASTLLPNGGAPFGPAGIALDPEGNVVIGAVSFGALTVTPGAFQTVAADRERGGASNGFLVKLDQYLSKLIFATYFSGSSYDGITGLATAGNGDVLFGGYSYSADLPMSSDGWTPCHPTPDFRWANGPSASFVGRISSDGTRLVNSSFVGPGDLPASQQPGWDLRLVGADAAGDMFLVGVRERVPVLVRYRLRSRPRGSAACIASATHGYETGLAPGAFTRIRGHAIAGSRTMPITLTEAGTLPLIFQGLQVTVGDKVAPLLEVLPDQLTIVTPFGTPVGQTVELRILQHGQVTSELKYMVQATAPALISADPSGLGSAAALNEDGSVNSTFNRARPGSVVSLFMTGLGVVTPEIVEGTFTSQTGSVITDLFITADGITADVLYAGPAPRLLAGVYQVNIRVPPTRREDWVPVGIQTTDQFGQSTAGNPRVGIHVTCPEGQTCIPPP